MSIGIGQLQVYYRYFTQVMRDVLSENWPFSQNSILPWFHIEIYWVKVHVLHENFTHTLITFVCTEIKLKSIHQWIRLFMENKKIFCFMFAQQRICELWVLNYNAVKTMFTIVIS